ncbi:MFS transporter [Labedaea rhizosphaerae]|uniref:MFS-type transporter involved in bile tolerance (Atg22 family) n=1 Tax=Labedaea rhizosphaerae TaxID=598644 RepID=A0A4R6SHU4_LABRH|nr:MFS transporter [Labedaea rhizosphaerae]TDQ00946.1 MFS-type transporter involved in bile tolerance (Atg22 family) [Labedaea rhizosphaerae]
MGTTSLGRPFGWYWTSYAVSTVGTYLAFDAFPLIAILVLHAAPAAVSALASVGLAAGAVLAVPLGPWMEFRRKRPVMIAADVVRFLAVLSVPAAFAFGLLTFGQLLVVTVVVAVADNAFRAAAGACLKSLAPGPNLLVANGRIESTMWTSAALGPPLGGAAIGLLGPVTTAAANAVSYLLSALAIRAIGPFEPTRPTRPTKKLRAGDLLEGWRYILDHKGLRLLFTNTLVVNALLMATAPLMATRMLGELGFSPLQYAIAFGPPCAGGLVGARLSRRLTARIGERQVLRVFGALRACWPIGLAFLGPGMGGLALVLIVQTGLVTTIGVFNPVYATYRLQQTPDDRVARVLAAWNVSSSATTATVTALWGVLAGFTSPGFAVAAAGVVLLTTPLILRGLPGTLAAPEEIKEHDAVDPVPGGRSADGGAGA